MPLSSSHGLTQAKPSAPHPAIVRFVMKATVASVEIKKPAGKWEKVSDESYARIQPDPKLACQAASASARSPDRHC